MKTLKIIFCFILTAPFFSSCVAEPIYSDAVTYSEPVAIPTDQLLAAYDLWYVDINSAKGYGETPFLQKAFTISFINGVIHANNNIAGLGANGNGFGIDVGTYDAYNSFNNNILDVVHDIDGFSTFDVFQIDYNTIELYNPNNDTSYFLDGYQRHNFDYDFVFYDNIHYFLQEYEVWEKVYTSDFGMENAFDNENYLQFLAGGNDATFRSSQDHVGIHLNTLVWDYTGVYGVDNVRGHDALKILTLGYNESFNEVFELTVINDHTIELFHTASETVYRFEGLGYIQYLKSSKDKKETISKKNTKRKFRKDKVKNPRSNTRKLS